MIFFQNWVIQPLSDITSNWSLLIQVVNNDIRQKYAGSIFGKYWFFLNPVLFLIVYALVYIFIYKIQFPSVSVYQYVLYIFCGVFTLQMFTEGLSNGATSLLQNKSLISNSVFPAELIVIRSIATCLVPGFVSMFLALLLATSIGNLSLSVVVVPYILIMMAFFLAGIGMFLGAFTLIMRDIPEVLKFINIVLLIMSPIAYFINDVPQLLRLIIYINPLAYYMIIVQNAMVFGKFPSIIEIIVISILSLFVYCCGSYFMRRLKAVLSDYAT